MALRNKSISEFGKRLYELIDEKDDGIINDEEKIRSPRGLAKQLLKQGLVHVKTNPESFNDETTDHNNAVSSVEKKIVRHIKTGMIGDKYGEFVKAYSKFFACSSDYILGLTPIKSPDVEIRRICELTGLSENVVQRLVDISREGENQLTTDWSDILGSSLFESIPSDWSTITRIAYEKSDLQGRLEALNWEKKYLSKKKIDLTDPMIFDIPRDIDDEISMVEEEIANRDAAFYGTLSKVSKNMADYIEGNAKAHYDKSHKKMIDMHLSLVKRAYKDMGL